MDAFAVGDIAKMMLEGILCQHCGSFLDGEQPGYPRNCGCDPGSMFPPGPISEAKDRLPPTDVSSIKEQCSFCGKWKKNVNAHIFAVHTEEITG